MKVLYFYLLIYSIISSTALMSVSTTPPVETGKTCSTCGRFVPFHPNQNKDSPRYLEPVATCHAVNAVTGKRCNWVRWPTPTSRTASPFLSPPPTFTPLVTAPSATPVQPVYCGHTGCKQTRLDRECARRLCKKHCVELGGCMPASGHRTRDMIAAAKKGKAPVNQNTQLATPSTPLEPSSAHGSNNPSATALVVAAGGRGASEPAPRYTTAIRPGWDDQAKMQALLAEKGRENTAARMVGEKRANHSVTLYVWKPPHGSSPHVRIVQPGESGPYFVLNEKLLRSIGLWDAFIADTMQAYNLTLGLWVHVELGHTVPLKEAILHFYLRASENLEPCRDLDRYLTLSTSTTTANISLRDNLAGARAYVRQETKIALRAPAIAKSAVAGPSGRALLVTTPPPATRQDSGRPSKRTAPSSPLSIRSSSESPISVRDTSPLTPLPLDDAELKGMRAPSEEMDFDTFLKGLLGGTSASAGGIGLAGASAGGSAGASGSAGVSGSGSAGVGASGSAGVSGSGSAGVGGSGSMGGSGSAGGSGSGSAPPSKPRPRRVAKKIKVEISTNSARKRFTVPIDAEVNDLTGFTPSPPPSHLYGTPPLPANGFQWPEGSKAEPIDLDTILKKKWPSDSYVFEIVACLNELHNAKRGGSEAVFNKHFPHAKYCRSTIHDQRKKLNHAPASIKNEALKAGSTHLGLWSTFCQNLRYHEDAIRTGTVTMASGL